MNINYQHSNWQQKMGEYFMFFQINTRSEFTIAKK